MFEPLEERRLLAVFTVTNNADNDAGSLRDHTLHELWTSGRPFTRLRLLEGNGDCWTCRHYDHCGGGCRARALAATGDLDAKDPWCKWEPLPDAAAMVLP